jgi:type III secretion system FlhB-like substrate exporter
MKKPDRAAAIGYLKSEGAPKIFAAARGILVEKMLKIAEKYNVSVYRDPDLAEVLSAMKQGSFIPEDLFAAVAEVMAFCYRVNSRFREKLDREGG